MSEEQKFIPLGLVERAINMIKDLCLLQINQKGLGKKILSLIVDDEVRAMFERFTQKDETFLIMKEEERFYYIARQVSLYEFNQFGAEINNNRQLQNLIKDIIKDYA